MLAQDGCLPYGTLIISYLRCCGAASYYISGAETTLSNRDSVTAATGLMPPLWSFNYLLSLMLRSRLFYHFSGAGADTLLKNRSSSMISKDGFIPYGTFIM